MKVLIGLAAVPLSVVRPYMKNWDRKGLGVQALNRFNKGPKKYRLYIPIKALKQAAKPPTTIKQAVEAAGYKIEDYVLGIASKDGGTRKIKIGKILPDHLKQVFANDKGRAAYKNEYVCVISYHPYDIVGMSTGRRWDKTSCMRIGHAGNNNDDGAYSETVANDVAEGTLVAYAIRPSDENINKPIARLLIKPFYSTDGSGNILFRVETNMYGTKVPGFSETVVKWLKKLNTGVKHGLYRLADGLYDDGVGESIVNAPYDDFKDDDARVAFLSKLTGIKMRAVRSDPRWVDLVMQMESDRVQTLVQAIEDADGFDVPPRYIGKAIDNATLDAYIDDVGTFVMDSVGAHTTTYLDILKSSKLLRKWAREKYRYSPKHSLYGKDIRRGMSIDSRWIREWAYDTTKFNYVLRCSLNGEVKIDRWLTKPTNELGHRLFNILQLMVAVLHGRKLRAEPNQRSVRAASVYEKLLAVGFEPKLVRTNIDDGHYFIRYVLGSLGVGFDTADIAKQLIRFDENWIEAYLLTYEHLPFSAIMAPDILPLFEKTPERTEIALEMMWSLVDIADHGNDLFKFPIEECLAFIERVKPKVEEGSASEEHINEFFAVYNEAKARGDFQKR